MNVKPIDPYIVDDAIFPLGAKISCGMSACERIVLISFKVSDEASVRVAIPHSSLDAIIADLQECKQIGDSFGSN